MKYLAFSTHFLIMIGFFGWLAYIFIEIVNKAPGARLGIE